VKSAYKRDFLNLGVDVDLDCAGPMIHGAGVAGYDGWLAGYQMVFDTAKSKLTMSNFAIGYKTGDFQLHTNVYVVISGGVTTQMHDGLIRDSSTSWYSPLDGLVDLNLDLVIICHHWPISPLEGTHNQDLCVFIEGFLALLNSIVTPY